MARSIFDFQLTLANGQILDLKKYEGKKLLLVNTATACGLTPQLKKLQTLSEKYSDILNIIGTPCNQFKAQEPLADGQIATHCKINYGVDFQLSVKLDVKGQNIHPIWEYTTKQASSSFLGKRVWWNFQKYLFNEKGQLITFYMPFTSPLAHTVVSKIIA